MAKRSVPRLTKQHFQLIADVLRQARDTAPDKPLMSETEVIDRVTYLFTEALRRTNSLFDSGRFQQAATT